MKFDFFGVGSVGPIKHGMTRDEIRKVLCERYDEFKKTEISTAKTDAFDSLNLHIFYEESGVVKGVEFFGGSEFYLEGERVVDKSLGFVKGLLEVVGAELDFNSSGFFVRKSGLRFYVPDIEEDDAVVEAVYVEMN